MKVALIAGGISAEREISLLSGKAMLNALNELGMKYKIIDPALGAGQYSDEADYFNGKTIDLNKEKYIECVQSGLFDDVDTALLALHGQFGEDGLIQSLFELKGIKYTGSGALASALAMDKSMSKVMFRHYNVITPEWFSISSADNDLKLVKSNIADILGYPCVIKPNDQGSTIGLTVCKDESMVPDALDLAFKFGRSVIVEEFIPGREITIGILNDYAFPVLEIKPKHALYDFECKYSDGMCDYIVPADLPASVSEHIRRQSLLAYRSLGCSGYGRVDLRLNDKMEYYCLEVNTLPGMTSHSLLPKMAEAEGISYAELVKKILETAL
jgi:D-alanine-D-alanine ligase